MSTRKIGPSSLARLLGGWLAGNGKAPAYRQLQQALRLLVLDGRMPVGVRLPGERHLAHELGISRTTVAAAYGELRELGFLESRHGSGSVTRLPGEAHRVADRPDEAGLIEFSIAALPAPKEIHAAFTAALAELPRYLPTPGYEPAGLPELRQAIADRYRRRGVPTDAHQILVTQGAQHGLVLLLGHLTRPGDQVIVDQPTYPKALDAIANASCHAVPIQLPPDGWDLDQIDAAMRQTGACLAYLIPDFHNPTGRCMDEFSRARLARLVAERQGWLVVDETMADLWLDAPPPPPVARFDLAGRAISLGSMGKTYWGGMRMGWIRADRDLIAALALYRSTHDMGSPILEQLAALSLLQGEEQDIAERRALLRRQRDHLAGQLRAQLPEWSFDLPSGGLSIWAELPSAVGMALTSAARDEGLRIAPGTRFGVDGALDRFLRLPFSMDEDRLTDAVARLACAWQLVVHGKCRPVADRLESLTAAI